MAYELAERWPATPQVFRACTAIYDFQFPPQLPRVVEAVVVVNDRVARHVAAMDGQYEVVRLRHPIDTRRPLRWPRSGTSPVARCCSATTCRGCGAGSSPRWEAAGVECVTVGASAPWSVKPEGRSRRPTGQVDEQHAHREGIRRRGRRHLRTGRHDAQRHMTIRRHLPTEEIHGGDPATRLPDRRRRALPLGDRDRRGGLRRRGLARHAGRASPYARDGPVGTDDPGGRRRGAARAVPGTGRLLSRLRRGAGGGAFPQCSQSQHDEADAGEE
jgi:hypothetical protein